VSSWGHYEDANVVVITTTRQESLANNARSKIRRGKTLTTEEHAAWVADQAERQGR
jgi:hypothetical protein